MTTFKFGLMTLAAMGLAAPALAAQVAVSTYDMNNGGGQASGGSYNYWDKAYSGSGATSTDGAPLTGGTGDLTDGVVASDFWYNVENGAGTGPYVGWYTPGVGQLNPTINFNFSGSPTITSARLHIDNSYVGGVFAPSAIWIDGAAVAWSGPAVGTIGWVDILGLNLTGGSHSLQLFQNGGWVFVSEVEFFGRGGVPEPATWALMIGGFGLTGAMLRRRRTLA